MIGRRAVLAKLAGAVLLALAAGPATAADSVTVFAAASLKNALDEVSAAWHTETGKRTTLSYAGSSALARQIEAGAPADVFISADLDWMNDLGAKNLIAAGSEVHLLGNRIVLIAPADSMASTVIAPGFGLAELVGDGRLALADVKAVPAGKYAKAALEKLGVWASVEAKVAQAENVRAALKLVSTGEAPVGIAYQTDANAEPNVKVIATFPEDTHPAIIYPAAQIAASQNPDAAAFLAYLQSQTAAGIFKAHGFTMLAPGN
jgi:molybdate transport system substrate-binding protein